MFPSARFISGIPHPIETLRNCKSSGSPRLSSPQGGLVAFSIASFHHADLVPDSGFARIGHIANIQKKQMGKPRIIKTNVETVVIPQTSREHFLTQPSPAVRCMDDYDILLAGISELTSGYRVERTPSYFNLILYCHGGSAIIRSNGRTLRMQRGEVMLIPTGSTYSYRPTGSHWAISWAHLIDTPGWNRLFEPSLQIHKAQWGERVMDVMKGYIEEAGARHPDSQHTLGLYIELLVSYLKRELGAASSGDQEAREKLQAVWGRVHKNLKHKWTAGEISSMAGLCKTNLFRLCEKIHRTTPLEMIAMMRMELATELLSFTNYTLTMIADETGYGNAFAFSKAFKRHTGMSPKEYRRQRVP